MGDGVSRDCECWECIQKLIDKQAARIATLEAALAEEKRARERAEEKFQLADGQYLLEVEATRDYQTRWTLEQQAREKAEAERNALAAELAIYKPSESIDGGTITI